MKEKLTNIILKHCDGDLVVINLSGMVDEIEELYASERKINADLAVDWAGIDPVKWGELERPIVDESLDKFEKNRIQGDIDMEEI